MGAFSALPLGRRPVRCRVLAVYRLTPGCLGGVLPEGLTPRLVQGYAIGAACYTRLGGAALFRARPGGSDHLAYRFAVQHEDGSEGAWIARRQTSSWLGAQWGSKLLGGVYARSSFRVKEDAFSIELTVAGERGEEFYLRGEVAGAQSNSLFRDAHALEHFLGADRVVRPLGALAPEADQLDLGEHFAPEPLAVFEARSAFFAEGPFAGRGAALDSAWRIVTRRLVGTVQRRAAFRALPEGPGAVPVI